MTNELLEVTSDTDIREISLLELKLHPLLDQVVGPPCGELPDGTALDVHLSPYLIVQEDNTILVGKELYLKLLEGEEKLAPALVVHLTPAEQIEVILSCAIARQTFNRDQQILVAAHWLIEEVKKSRSEKASKAAKQRNRNREAVGGTLSSAKIRQRVLDQCRDRFQLPVRLIQKARLLLENHPAEAQKVMAGQITLIDALKAMVAKLQPNQRPSNRKSKQTQAESTPTPNRGKPTPERESFSDSHPPAIDRSTPQETGSWSDTDSDLDIRANGIPGQDKAASLFGSAPTPSWQSSPHADDEDEPRDPYEGSLVLEITQTSRVIAQALLEYYHPQRCRSIVEDLRELIADD